MAEFIGSFLLVFISCWSQKAFELNKIDMIGLGAANGLAYTFLTYAGFNISGAHYNPVITLQYWVFKKRSLYHVFLYWSVQIAGSIIAAILVLLMMPLEFQTDISVSYPRQTLISTAFQTVMIEFILSFALSLVYFSQVKENQVPANTFGISIGGIVFAGIIAFGAHSGACINLLRMIGPSIITGNLSSDIMYVFILITGGTFGAYYYFDNFKDAEIDDPSTKKETAQSMKNPENLSFAQNLKY